jgi:DNA-binding response OmpR family regulator
MAYVLIVDDDEDLANTTATVLGKDGHDVGIELDTQSAMKSLQSKLPDLIILDVMFPEDATAGFTFAREVRQEPKYRELPILMLTAVNQKYPFGFSSKDIDDAWLPVTEFIEKPVDFDVLRAKVSALLGKKGTDSR